MRDNGKFQDSLLSLCVCNCVWTHRISCPGAFGKQTDNIQEKKKIPDSDEVCSLLCGNEDGQPRKATMRTFFGHVLKGLQTVLQSLNISFMSNVSLCLFSSFCLLQVNSMSVEGKTHSDVVAAIKAGGHETRLLVVDPETDAFFKRCRVTPTSEHLTGESTISCSLWGFTSCAEGVEQMSAFSCFIRHVMDTSLLLPSSQTSSTLKPRFFFPLFARFFLSLFFCQGSQRDRDAKPLPDISPPCFWSENITLI